MKLRNLRIQKWWPEKNDDLCPKRNWKFWKTNILHIESRSTIDFKCFTFIKINKGSIAKMSTQQEICRINNEKWRLLKKINFANKLRNHNNSYEELANYRNKGSLGIIRRTIGSLFKKKSSWDWLMKIIKLLTIISMSSVDNKRSLYILKVKYI